MGRVGDSGVGACLLLGGVGFWGLCYRALGIVDLVPVHGVWGLVLAPLVAGAMFSGSFGLRVS